MVLPAHLRTLARVSGEVNLDLAAASEVSLQTVLDALETRHPELRGTLRDQVSRQRRPYVRFFACGQDISLDPPQASLPAQVAAGSEPLLVIGAMAGG